MEGLRLLHDNIEGYLRRYYLGKLISGALISLGAAVALWVVFALIEHVYRLENASRMVLFFGFIFMAGGLLVLQVLIPGLQYLGFLRRLNEQDAARSIGRMIPDIDDRLINAITLESSGLQTSRLVQASLDQRAKKLNVFDFRTAVDLKRSLMWLRITAIPLFVVFFITLWDGSLLTNSARRIVHYNENFVAPAPFHFELNADQLRVIEGKPFELKVSTVGSALPDHVFVEIEGSQFRMKSTEKGDFVYTFNNVRNDVPFQLRGASVYSERFVLKVLAQPKVLENNARLDYPAYTGLKDEQFVNRTKLVVPEGTEVAWLLALKDVSEPSVRSEGRMLQLEREGNAIQFSDRFTDSRQLHVQVTSAADISDSTLVDVVVVKDAYPSIAVTGQLDSAELLFYFNGILEDDYGFSDLRFVAEDAEGEQVYTEQLQLQSGMREQSFAFAWSADSLLTAPGDEVAYYFQAWDNDGVNGAKMSTTQVWKYTAPSKEALKEENDKQFEKTKEALSEEEKSLEELQKELDEARKDLLEKKDIDWEDKEALKELLDQRKEMMEKLQKKSEQQKQQLDRSNKFNEFSEELMQKQQMIQEMFDRLFDDEFKKKYEEYNKLLEEMTKDQMLQKLDEMELDNEKLEKELDRTLELFKQLEFEQNLEERLNELDEMIADQEEVQEKTEEKSAPKEELSEEQESIADEMKEFEEAMKDMQDLNESLEEPNEMPDLQEKMDGAQEDMDSAKEELNKSNEKKAGQEQQKAKEKMQEMRESLSSFQQQMAQDQQTENMEHMRQLLENIVELSKGQERVMEALKPIKGSDPKYVEYAKQQKDLIDDTKVVEDSLLALSKRVPQIDKKINDEIADVKFNMGKALTNLTNQPPNQEQRYKAMAAERQQQSMTALNNLALLFDDMIKSMQQQMQSSMQGTGQCEKPGQSKGSKPSAAQMRKMQESLNKQLQKLKEAMEKGENPNGKKPGQSEGMGMGGQSKELARMAAEQSAIRKQLREMSQSLENNGQGGSAKEMMEEIERLMEETEEDILYRQISAETMRRQEDILTKLLESEKADRERELEEKRESKSAGNNYEIPSEIWEEFVRKREQELELYRTVPPNLKPFYRNEVNRYFSNFQD